jgi:thioesterase domain-containing protein
VGAIVPSATAYGKLGDVLETQPSKLVYLKRNSGRDAVLIVPGIGGSVLSLVWLARAYPGPEPVAALEPVSLGTVSSSFASVADLASSHLAAARAQGRDGGWHLVGHCFGATVVMEMARQLEESGERPRTVCFLQPFLRLGGARDGEERGQAELKQDAADRLRSALQRPGHGAALEDDPDVRRDLGQLDLDPAVLRFGREFALSLLDYAGFALRAYLDHPPLPISAPVHLLVAADCRASFGATEGRLRELTGGVALHELSCPSGAMLRQPHARTVAEEIASLIG